MVGESAGVGGVQVVEQFQVVVLLVVLGLFSFCGSVGAGLLKWLSEAYALNMSQNWLWMPQIPHVMVTILPLAISLRNLWILCQQMLLSVTGPPHEGACNPKSLVLQDAHPVPWLSFKRLQPCRGVISHHGNLLCHCKSSSHKASEDVWFSMLFLYIPSIRPSFVSFSTGKRQCIDYLLLWSTTNIRLSGQQGYMSTTRSTCDAGHVFMSKSPLFFKLGFQHRSDPPR